MIAENLISEKITQITTENQNPIIILKGIEPKLDRKQKYFSFEKKYYDQVHIPTLKKEAFEQLFKNNNFTDGYRWMTMEEYQVFREFPSISKNPIVVLENNLYDKQFPYQGTLENVDKIYDYLYYQEDNELEPEQQEIFENVSFFYGRIDYSKQSNNYYVTYPELDKEFTVYKLYDERPIEVTVSEKYPTSNAQQIELSDDEIPFLDLESDILSKTNELNIIFVLSDSESELPNKYLERINILKNISSIKVYFTKLSIRRKIIENEPEYAEILQEIFGYPEFKQLEFYSDIESHSKATVKISQAQIIDDIVDQSENAMNGSPFRDIYITAATGAGKSVMFQIPTLYLIKKYKTNKPLTLVITPLIALMEDQVAGLKRKGLFNAATVNGNTPPHEKEEIVEGVKKGQIDILYLSPESLQARSDITTLIGDRSIGNVIIDEAHIVTTWGKSFRADYWYLGIYLAKLRKKYKFPIVTFTATAIYGGPEDMYLDTRDSLNMISPVSYFGVVRRNNLLMEVRNADVKLDKEGRDYRKTKMRLALDHMEKADKNNEKSLLYFPTIRLLEGFYNYLKLNNPKLAEKTGQYHGRLSKEEKEETLAEYRSGEMRFVLATKAFGMGIDIADITNVYHYAPTGSVVDYVQEIGRAARDTTKITHGFGHGVIDFLPKDMNEVKKLYGMSAIKKNQILAVMNKVLSIYKDKGNQRNLIVSPEDFKNIFVQNKRDEDSLDNKVKTVLLMIEKDFESPNKIGYSPFVARPRSLYGTDLIFVTNELEKYFVNNPKLGKYFKPMSYEGEDRLRSKNYSAIYQVDLSGIWEKYYKKMSFASFKFALHNQAELDKLQDKHIFSKFNYASGIYLIKNSNITKENIISDYRRVLDSFEDFTNQQKITGGQFTVNDLGSYFSQSLKIADKFNARTFAQTVINAAFEFNKIKNLSFIVERTNSSVDKQRYIIHEGVDVFKRFIIETIKYLLYPSDNFYETRDSIISFYYKSATNEIDAKIAALSIGEAMGLFNYQLIGGDNPQIYLRMNAISPLEKAIKQGDFYKNGILEDVKHKHYSSVEMLKYLFTHEQPEKLDRERILNYTNWFWDTIENYFMGVIPKTVQDKLNQPFE